MRRVIGLDIHRVFAEAVMLDAGKIVPLGRVGMTREHLRAFARTLTHDDHVVVEATGNAAAVSEVLAPHVGRVVIANPRQVRLIAEARIKTDTIDATVLARLYASGFLPEVWVPDERTLALRRQVTRRNQIVRQRARLKLCCSPSCTHIWCRRARLLTCSDPRAGPGCYRSSCLPMKRMQSRATCASTTVLARISERWNASSHTTHWPAPTQGGS